MPLLSTEGSARVGQYSELTPRPGRIQAVTERHQSLTNVTHERLFVVADYQRPYAWEERQLGDLWDDLDLLGRGHHYAGTVVLRSTDEPNEITSSGEELATFEVVDGQQRLTTCLLLLDRLRRRLGLLSRNGEKGVEGIDETAVQLGQLVMVSIGGVRRPRLRLGNGLHDFWRDSILGDQPLAGMQMTASQQRLGAAGDFLDGKLETLVAGVDDEKAALRLLDLRRRITSGLRFLVYEVDTTAEV